MTNVSDSIREKIKTHTFCSVTLFEIRNDYDIMWKNTVKDRPQMTIWRMRITYWIPKTKITPSHVV